MKKARDEIERITKIRLEFRDILVAHDIVKFRSFMRAHKELAGDDAATACSYGDDKLSEYMHALKCTMPLLGEDFAKSRNYFREKQLVATLPGCDNTVLRAYVELKKAYPVCNNCKYFRQPPQGESLACMHLVATPEKPDQRPAIPTDIACGAWAPAGQKAT